MKREILTTEEILGIKKTDVWAVNVQSKKEDKQFSQS